MMTECRAETKYLLRRALLTRGLKIDEQGDTFYVATTVGRFALTIIPGNRRVVLCHGTWIEPQYRGKGYGKKWNELKEEIARESGFNLMIGTVRNDNDVQNHFFKTHGWVKFTDRAATGVSLWGKEL